MNNENKFELNKYLYYSIIGLTSLIACIFLPMLGSEVNIAFNVPNTAAGWVVFIITKLIIAVINMLIFYCFMEQAKVNVKDDEQYKEANEILKRTKNKKVIPRSPQHWNKMQYSKKGTTIFLTSILSAFALTNAILNFNLAEMLTYIFVITMGLIFGILQMKSAERYWSIEYWEYAVMIRNEEQAKEQDKTDLEMVENKLNQQRDIDLHSDRGVNILESDMGNSDNCNYNKSLLLDTSDSNHSVLGRTINTSNPTTDSTNICTEETRTENNKEKEER